MSILKIMALGIWVFLVSILAMLSLIDRSHGLYIKVSRLFAKGIFFLSGVKLKVTGLENLDPSQAYVYVSNHAGNFDIPAMMLASPNRMRFVFKKELARIPVFGWQLSLGPYIIIDRQNPEKAMRSIEKAKQVMDDPGDSVLLFAEGTRSKTGEVQPFKRGAFYLAARVYQPVVPVSICNSWKIMPKSALKIVPGEMQVHFDKPITVSGAMNKREELALMEKVRNIVIQNKERFENGGNS